MYQGSCLCGAVKYEVHGELGKAVYCHCSLCRKASGSAFAANAPVAADDFRIVEGRASLKSFSASAGEHRLFCSRCGSHMLSRRDDAPHVVRIRLGTLETPLAVGPLEHVFVGSKAAWFEIHDELPQHHEMPQ